MYVKDVIVKDVGVWNFPSGLIVAWEYAQIHLEGCPNCGSKDIEFVKQAALPKYSNDWQYPIQGDLITAKCRDCGYAFDYKFIFRYPYPNESPLGLFEDILEIYLDLCSNGMVPDYLEFIDRMRRILIALKMEDTLHSINLYRQALDVIAKRMRAMMDVVRHGSQSLRDLNKLKLLIALWDKLGILKI